MYSFKYGGRGGTLVRLELADDLVIVRTHESKSPIDAVEREESRMALRHLAPSVRFPEANVTVLQVQATESRKLAARDNARAVLKQDSRVRFAGRGLRDADSGAPVVYTENFFVKFRDTLPPERCEEILSDHGLTVKRRLSYAANAYFAAARPGTGLEVFRIANELLDCDDVELSHPELVREVALRQAAPQQWHLMRTSVNERMVDAHVNALSAWESTRGREIVIAIIDDGVDVDHVEFRDKIVAPRDVTLGTGDGRPKRTMDNHGTACAGVACASGQQAAGVAPEAKLMPIRHVSGLGSQAEADAFVWAADNGADVISCSWGPADAEWWNLDDARRTRRVLLPDSTRLAIDYATRTGRSGKGCVICWAAGNGNESVDNDGYASYERVIAVGACNDRGTRSVYSDYGRALWCCFPSNDFEHAPFDHPAPRTPGIWTTDRSGRLGYNPGSLFPAQNRPPGDDHGHYTDRFGGTSSSCPGAAAVAALVLAVNSNLDFREVKDLFRRCCTRIDELQGEYDNRGHSIFYGYGRLDAERAVALAREGLGLEPTELSLAAQALGILRAEDDRKLYKIHLSRQALITLDGPDGSDFDLYVRRGQPPTLQIFDERGYTSAPHESITLSVPGPDVYYLLVHSYRGSGPFELKVIVQ